MHADHHDRPASPVGRRKAAPLSPVDLITWLRSCLDSPTLGKSGRLVAAVLVTYHNSQTGLTCPSIRTIAKRARLSLESVIAGYRELEAEGWLTHRERSSWADSRDRMSHLYALATPADAPRRQKPRRGHVHDCGTVCDAEVFKQPEHPRSETPSTPVRITRTRTPERETRAKNNDRPGAAAATDLSNASSSRLKRLAYSLQQLATAPGYRLATATIDTGRAVQAVGIEAVEDLARQLQPQRGTLRVHEIRAALDRLRLPKAAPHPARAALANLDPAAVAQARRLYDRIRPTGSAAPITERIQISAAIRKAGHTVPLWADADGCILTLARVIEAGHLTPA